MQDGAGHHSDIRDRCRKRMRRRLRALESPNSSEVRGVKTGIANSSRVVDHQIGTLPEGRWVQRMTTWRPGAGNNCSLASTSGNATMEEIASGRRPMEGIVVAVSLWYWYILSWWGGRRLWSKVRMDFQCRRLRVEHLDGYPKNGAGRVGSLNAVWSSGREVLEVG